MASPTLSMSGLPIKIIIRDPYVVFKAEYLWNGKVKKDGVNTNLMCCNTTGLILDAYIDFAFSHLNLFESFKIVQSQLPFTETNTTCTVNWYTTFWKSLFHRKFLSTFLLILTRI